MADQHDPGFEFVFMTLMYLLHRADDARRYGCQRFPAGWREVVVLAGSADEIMAFGEFVEAHAFPLTYRIFPQIFVDLCYQSQRSGNTLGGVPAALQRT
jgi:hypothetical protein